MGILVALFNWAAVAGAEVGALQSNARHFVAAPGVGRELTMNPESKSRSWHRPRLLTLLVLIVVMAGIVLDNLSSVPVSADLLDSGIPQRPYGWPLTWYWRIGKPGITPGHLRWPVSRHDTSPFVANLVMWLAALGVAYFACELLQRRYRFRLHFRPQVTTLFVLMIILTPTVLANLTFDSPGSWKASFGWPFTWYWFVYIESKSFGPVDEWDYSAVRLAGNLAVWILTLALAGLAWEWIARRYRPRLRWSLRTLLIAVGLAAAFCAWCAGIRNRAREQDALIAWAGEDNVLVERWGPKWLDLLGIDPYRRLVVGAVLNPSREHNELPSGLARLRDLRYLEFSSDLFTPNSAAELSEMQHLRTLIIRGPIETEQTAHSCFAWLGKQSHLERLCLEMCGSVRGDDLGSLCGLTKLKSLRLENHYCEKEVSREWLAAIGELTQLERLSLDLEPIRLPNQPAASIRNAG